MVKIPLSRVEGDIEIFCYEITKNPLQNFQISFNLIHFIFSYQYLVIPIFALVNLEKFESAVSLSFSCSLSIGTSENSR